jgi:hypothetical protein
MHNHNHDHHHEQKDLHRIDTFASQDDMESRLRMRLLSKAMKERGKGEIRGNAWQT